MTSYLQDELTGGATAVDFTYGAEDDVALLGDWNGDGLTAPGVVRSN